VIIASVAGAELRFETAPHLFSPEKLDPGTLAMLSAVRFEAGDKVLDLGCGYGVVGVLAAMTTGPGAVWMVDNDPVAVELAARNARLNGVEGINATLSDGLAEVRETGFTKILSNPPYHADFSVPKRFIEKGFNRLAIGGALWMVTRREAWYRNKLTAIFGGVRVRSIDGYFVFEATKRSASYASARPRQVPASGR
jgi:16S rRNA (guanine1207-N2)-methyltransferase